MISKARKGLFESAMAAAFFFRPLIDETIA